jgi:post-segregation antitoxin (ccd killing protein)
MKDKVLKPRKITLTVSCPPDLLDWLRLNKPNVSAFVVGAIEAQRRRSQDEPVR